MFSGIPRKWITKNIHRFVPGVTTHNNSGFKSKDEKEPGTEIRRKLVQAVMLLQPTRFSLPPKLCLTVGNTNMQQFLWAKSSSRKIQALFTLHNPQQNWSMCVHVSVYTYLCIWVCLSLVLPVLSGAPWLSKSYFYMSISNQVRPHHFIETQCQFLRVLSLYVSFWGSFLLNCFLRSKRLPQTVAWMVQALLSILRCKGKGPRIQCDSLHSIFKDLYPSH